VVQQNPHAHRVGLLLHGIMGSSKNVLSIARLLTTQFPDWKLVLPDLDHGRCTLQECAQDVLELVKQLGLQPELYIGHSFGGKVALCLNELHPVLQVWVWDSEPGLVEPKYTRDSVRKLQNVQMPQPSKKALQQAVLEQGLGRDVAAWMTTNLVESDQGYVWRFDLKNIERLLDSFGKTKFEVQDNTNFVKAEKSSHMKYSDSRHVFVLKNAGHWVHIDNPAGLVELVALTMNGRNE
jgi:pimeloyl-ACP methyl ester carboxylesterase